MSKLERYGHSPAKQALPLIQVDHQLKKAEAIVEELLRAFVPTVKAQFRLSQAQGGATIRAREWLDQQRGARAAHVESRTSD